MTPYPYKIGDYVKLIDNYGSLLKDIKGIVRDIPENYPKNNSVGIEWETDKTLHNLGCHGNKIEQNKGYYVPENYVKLVQNVESCPEFLIFN